MYVIGRKKKYEALPDELERGVYPNQKEALKLIGDLPFLTVNAEVIEIAQVYIAHKTMPKDPTGETSEITCNLKVTVLF